MPTSSPTLTDRLIISVALILPTLITWIYFILLKEAPAAIQQSAYTLCKIAQFALPVVWVCLVQRERPNFNRPSAWSLFVGTLFGLAVAAAMAALYFTVLLPSGLLASPITAVKAKVSSFGVSSPAAYLFLAIFYSALHSLLEEYYWRWFVFGQLSRVTRIPTAVALSSIGFAAHHVLVLQLYFGWLSPLTWLFTLSIIIGGAFWAWLYRASNSLGVSWISHAIVDAAIFAIGYHILIT